MIKTPNKMMRGPGKLVSLFNGLREFVIMRDIIIGRGLQVNETQSGRMVSVSTTLQNLAIQIEEHNDGGGVSGNPFTGGGSGGSGLPDVITDPATGVPTHDGKPLGWRDLRVCVADGAGGYTPMTMAVYGTTPH